MRPLQAQSPLPSQYVNVTLSTQAMPGQHWLLVVQACPLPVQLAMSQVPLVEPAGTLHE